MFGNLLASLESDDLIPDPLSDDDIKSTLMAEETPDEDEPDTGDGEGKGGSEGDDGGDEGTGEGEGDDEGNDEEEVEDGDEEAEEEIEAEEEADEAEEDKEKADDAKEAEKELEEVEESLESYLESGRVLGPTEAAVILGKMSIANSRLGVRKDTPSNESFNMAGTARLRTERLLDDVRDNIKYARASQENFVTDAVSKLGGWVRFLVSSNERRLSRLRDIKTKSEELMGSKVTGFVAMSVPDGFCIGDSTSMDYPNALKWAKNEAKATNDLLDKFESRVAENNYKAYEKLHSLFSASKRDEIKMKDHEIKNIVHEFEVEHRKRGLDSEGLLKDIATKGVKNDEGGRDRVWNFPGRRRLTMTTRGVEGNGVKGTLLTTRVDKYTSNPITSNETAALSPKEINNAVGDLLKMSERINKICSGMSLLLDSRVGVLIKADERHNKATDLILKKGGSELEVKAKLRQAEQVYHEEIETWWALLSLRDNVVRATASFIDSFIDMSKKSFKAIED